jgi:hypothetical protein
MEPLDDRELSALLREWKAPEAPARMRGKLLLRRAAWWRRAWQVEIRIPLPVAIVVALLLALGAWRRLAPPGGGTLSLEPGQSATVFTFRELTPVKELKPRIIRRDRAEN